MKIIQIMVGALALSAAGLECYYLLGIGQWTTDKQPLTAWLYIMFFWLLWVYARITDYVSPTLRLNRKLVRVLASVVIAGPFLILLVIGSTSSKVDAEMIKVGAFNGAILTCYSLVAVVAIFGDEWLGFVARFLKMGRQFPRTDAG